MKGQSVKKTLESGDKKEEIAPYPERETIRRVPKAAATVHRRIMS
jgi:hypothetical protein